ncbi:glycosyl transferase [Skermanella aerolata]|uniref:Glycosyl transferase n=1 Tax=Skermanella aerolata TaxID=393310 RepID=A0A512E0W5_9PROT|nr:glycosyltransferase [Skermanella aerolata]KJB91599.1 glycosyl transferase [Skermanella aerolata KACC 11604]GEO42366.1 glycosyl transferase [Skermanella aerolata]
MYLPVAALAFAIWLYLLLGRGGYWRFGLPKAVVEPAALPPVVAVVPARNEAAVVGRAVASLLDQDYPAPLHVVLVDDHSDDGTAAAARAAAAGSRRPGGLTVCRAPVLPPGWAGKVWAMRTGLEAAAETVPDAAYVLFTDADIDHPPGGLRQLAARSEAERLDLNSLMVRLHCETVAERATMPAFVYFFRMLYPFRWVNDPGHAVAAAAGGVMLVRREAVDRIGGLTTIRSELIDDCALAAAIKAGGHRIRLELAEEARSLRGYGGAGNVWRMIARSAYTQLRYSPLLLAGVALAMTLVFIVPPVVTVAAEGPARWMAAAAWTLMVASYLPALKYHGRSPLWAPALPLVAAFYLGATLDSARRHRMGRGGEWKGRMRTTDPVR